MVFMFSEPLVYKDVQPKNTKYYPSKLQQIEFNLEYEMIKQTIKKHGISFSIVK
jgi:hypothetical protein